jgi:hypothetical protein
VVDKYIERHPDEAGSALEREARAATLTAAARGYAATGALARAAGRWARASKLAPRRAVPSLYYLARLAAGRLRRAS